MEFRTCFILVCLLTIEIGCAPPEKEVKLYPQSHITVLLDLSDRIIETPNQIKRDREIVTSIYRKFVELQKKQMFIGSQDKFRLRIAHQKEQFSNRDKIFDFADLLSVNMSDFALSDKKDIVNTLNSFSKKLNDLYSEAKISENPNDYKGADIAGYLRDSYVSEICDEQMCDNYLIIITDGYQYVQGVSKPLDDWKAATDLSKVDVLVMEMDPKNGHKQEMDAMWKMWLKKMNAQSSNLYVKSGMKELDETLNSFFRLNSGAIGATYNGVEKEDSVRTEDSAEVVDRGIQGDYFYMGGSGLRTMRIEGSPDAGDDFICSILQLGEQYQGLTCRFDKAEDILDIDGLGKYIYSFIDGKEVLRSLSSEVEFEKSN